jgi:uncharacterized protein DUF4190
MDQQNTPQYVTYTAPMPLPSSSLATLSMVMGILGFTFLPLIATVIALITGYAARKETRSVPPRASGDGMATAGIIMGWIQVGLAAVVFVCVAVYMVFVLVMAGAAIYNGR